MNLFNRDDIRVDINNVEVGYVCKKEEDGGLRYLRKIVFARNTGVLAWDNSSIIQVNGRSGDALLKDGIDLCEKINGVNIVYPVISNITEINDTHDIVIYKPIEVGDLLKFLGFPEILERKNLNFLKRALLDSNYPLVREKTKFRYDDFNKIDLKKLEETIKQYSIFKSEGTLANITPEEKEFFGVLQKRKY